MIGFISWQTAFGFFVAGFICGWVVSIVVANLIVKRHKHKK